MSIHFKKGIGKWGINSWGNLGNFLSYTYSVYVDFFSNRSSAFANFSAFFQRFLASFLKFSNSFSSLVSPPPLVF
jgi:hypothetical protein